VQEPKPEPVEESTQTSDDNDNTEEIKNILNDDVLSQLEQ